MIVEELIRELEGMDRDAEVRFASQPSWPYEYSISEHIIESNEEALPVVYLAEEKQLGYLPSSVKDLLGW